MRHPTDGTLRRLLDEPAGVADADREHVAGCPECLTGLAAAQEDAALTGAALQVDLAVDVDAGWSPSLARGGRRRAPPADCPGAAPAPRAPHRWRAALRSPVVAVIGVVVLLAGASAAAAADWLQIFRTEQIAPVTVNEADLRRAAGPLRVRRGRADRGRRCAGGFRRRRRCGGHRALGPAGERAAPRCDRRTDVPGRRPGDRRVHVLGREGGAGRRGGRRDLAATARGPRRQPVPA